jgi:hypothetical protein
MTSVSHGILAATAIFIVFIRYLEFNGLVSKMMQ